MIVHRSPLVRKSTKTLAAILLLGFFEALPTLIADLSPDLFADLLSPLQRQILSLAMLSVLAATVALAQKSAWPRGRLLVVTVLIGLGLFALPALFLEVTKTWLTPVTRAALFTLVPFFAVIFEPYLTQCSVEQSRGGLFASLISVAGALLVLPVTMPNSLPAVASFAALGAASASIAASSCVADRILLTLKEESERLTSKAFSMASFAAVSGSAAFLGLAVLGAFTKRSWPGDALPATLAWSAMTELPALLLLFWLIPRLSAPRISTRFTLSLMFPILVGAALLGAHLTLRDWSGVALMAAGTAYILLAPEDKPDILGLSLQ